MSATIPLSRIDIRMTSEIKQTIIRAAQLSMVSVNTYLINTAYDNAKKVISEHETLMLSNEERDRFLALVDNPPEPTEKAKAAMRQSLNRKKRS